MNPNTNNPFGNLSQEGLEDNKDTLGGGSFIFDSGLYTGEITLAYAGESKGGARSMTFHLKTEDGRDYRETVYVTSGREKGQKHFYEKDGKQYPLPGFVQANDIALLATGLSLGEQEFEEKVVKLYDFDEKKEVPTKIMAAVSLHGKKVQLGIQRVTETKKKNDGNGNFVSTGETRDVNNIDKVFHAETGKTVSEYTRKVDQAEFIGQWRDKWTGVTKDKTDKGGASGTGAPGQKSGGSGGSTGGGKSLFG